MAIFSKNTYRIRCTIMFLFSFFFTLINIIAYMISIGKIDPISALPTLNYFNGIGKLLSLFSRKPFQAMITACQTNWVQGVAWFAPSILLILSVVEVIRDAVHIISGKFTKIEHIVMPILICFIISLICFLPLVLGIYNGVDVDLFEYLSDLASQDTLSFCVGILGILYVLIALLLVILPKLEFDAPRDDIRYSHRDRDYRSYDPPRRHYNDYGRHYDYDDYPRRRY